VERRLARGVTD